MTTALDLITRAMQSIGALGDGETPTSSEAQDCLDILNEMMDGLSIDRSTIYEVRDEIFPLTANDGTYTIGASGDFNTTRPVKLTGAFIRDSGNIDYPLVVLDDRASYDGIVAKDVTSDIPLYLFNDYAYPLSTIKLYPVPTVANSLHLTSWRQLQSFSLLTTALSLPNGYLEMIRYNLGIRICTIFEKSPPALLIALARDTLSKVRRHNRPASYQKSEIAQGKHSDIYAGTP